MTPEQFDEHIEHCIDRIRTSLKEKGREYMRGNNRFHNFDRGSKMDSVTPERSLAGMWAKHRISVMDIIDDIDKGNTPSIALLNEKISDNINYLIILEGLIKRRIDQEETERALKFHEDYCEKRDLRSVDEVKKGSEYPVYPYEVEESLSHT